MFKAKALDNWSSGLAGHLCDIPPSLSLSLYNKENELIYKSFPSVIYTVFLTYISCGTPSLSACSVCSGNLPACSACDKNVTICNISNVTNLYTDMYSDVTKT